MTQSGLSGSAQALATFASDGDNLARRACNSLTQGPYDSYWHAELGADGKDYRANFVHASFSGNSQQSSALKGSRSAARERG